jgi:hypothetical protein
VERDRRLQLSPAALGFSAARYRLRTSDFGLLAWFFAAVLAALSVAGCRSLPPLPPADLSAPGWRVHQGQALWKPPGNRPELAGELLLATNANGDCFVQFTKDPFPMATAQVAGDCWQIEYGAGERFRSGRGEPPHYSAWFQLSPALAGRQLTHGWQFERTAANSWRLANRRTGERVEGFLAP